MYFLSFLCVNVFYYQRSQKMESVILVQFLDEAVYFSLRTEKTINLGEGKLWIQRSSYRSEYWPWVTSCSWRRGLINIYTHTFRFIYLITLLKSLFPTDWFGLVSLFNGISTFVGYSQGYLSESERSSATGVWTRLRRFCSPSL